MINSNKKILTVLLAIIIFVAGFFTNTLYQKSQETMAKSTAKNFIVELSKGDTTKAYAASSQNFKKSMNKSDFDKVFVALKTDAPIYKKAVISKSGNYFVYQQAVDGLPKNASGSTEGDFAITLVRQGVSWKIDNVIVQ